MLILFLLKMSIIIGNGMCITYSETEVKCPICTSMFDASDKMEKAKYPVFKMKCPACKGAVGISVPIMGGNTECFEWNPSHRITNVTPNRVNGKIVTKKKGYDDNDDEDDNEPSGVLQ
jgi:hypothetical protein